jgi:hypothetical protein
MPRRSHFLALLGCATAIGCAPRAATDWAEPMRGQHVRLVPEAPDVLWEALRRALEDDGLEVVRADAPRGTMSTRLRPDPDPLTPRRLSALADLSGLRGLAARVSGVSVAHHLHLAPHGRHATRLTIRSEIVATLREELLVLPSGVFPGVARRLALPSRGAAERELMLRLASTLFTAEEMLFLLGELGVD